jgi:hypothetical protein
MQRPSRSLRAVVVTCALALGACALALGACAPTKQETVAPPAAPAKTGPVFTAAPGDVMVITDACAFRACPPGSPRAVSELVFLGMRSPSEAVFQRREESFFSGPTQPSGIAGVVVPDRPETAADTSARFIPPRGGQADPAAITEIVVNPVAGAAFGADDVSIAVTEITPGRVVYHLERL